MDEDVESIPCKPKCPLHSQKRVSQPQKDEHRSTEKKTKDRNQKRLKILLLQAGYVGEDVESILYELNVAPDVHE